MVKKTKKTVKRDQGGRFKKGTPGGPGRTKGTIQDVLCKDCKTRSVSVLLDDLLGAYATMGGGKFLAKWATQNHRNLTKFIDILFKFTPDSKAVDRSEHSKPLRLIISDQFLPKIGDKKAKEMPEPENFKEAEKIIRKLLIELKKKEEQLKRYKKHDVQDVRPIEHEPIRPEGLPEHKKEKEQPEDQPDQGDLDLNDNDEDEGDDENKPGWAQDLEDDLNRGKDD